MGDGEKLETESSKPDYLRLALTSRVYDMVHQTPLQYASGLSHRLQACVHIKREDLQPSFSSRIRGTYNALDSLRREGAVRVVTYSVGSQGHSLAVAAQRLGMQAVVVMPERVPLARRQTLARLGAEVHITAGGLVEAKQEAERLAAESSGSLVLLSPHDDPHVIAGQATVGLEIVRQYGAAAEEAQAEESSSPGGVGKLNAIFVCTGGSSLLAGVAAAVKQLMPSTKVIGVEPEESNLLERSLVSGHRVVMPEPSHFVDGAGVVQVGAEVFRLCNELVDDIVTVSNDEICAAVRDCFEDTRAMLEPAGAVSIAGLKRYLANNPAARNIPNANYVCISSDAANIEFDILRFVAERASMGEQKERLFALEVPDKAGSFYRMYKAVQPHWVTEFVYRHSPTHQKALVYMALERSDEMMSGTEGVKEVADNLAAVGVKATDVTNNEMAKTHAKYLAGGRPGVIEGERVIRFEFPEEPSSLARFLAALQNDWYITLLHYRNHGGQVGKVLCGIKVPLGQEEAFDKALEELGYTFHDETNNPIFLDYMR